VSGAARRSSQGRRAVGFKVGQARAWGRLSQAEQRPGVNQGGSSGVGGGLRPRSTAVTDWTEMAVVAACV
jgi:hypothetical protein